jgi:hypothetical protein
MVLRMKIEGLPVIDVDESEEITVAVRADDLLEGDTADPERHPIAIALRRQDNIDDARVTKNETLVRRGKKVVPLRRPGQAVVQAVEEDANGVRRFPPFTVLSGLPPCPCFDYFRTKRFHGVPVVHAGTRVKRVSFARLNVANAGRPTFIGVDDVALCV